MSDWVSLRDSRHAHLPGAHVEGARLGVQRRSPSTRTGDSCTCRTSSPTSASMLLCPAQVCRVAAVFRDKSAKPSQSSTGVVPRRYGWTAAFTRRCDSRPDQPRMRVGKTGQASSVATAGRALGTRNRLDFDEALVSQKDVGERLLMKASLPLLPCACLPSLHSSSYPKFFFEVRASMPFFSGSLFFFLLSHTLSVFLAGALRG